MNTLFWWLGENTIAVAVMVPFVLLASRLFRHRPGVQHALWVVVLLKFVTPPVVAWPWTVEQVRDSIWSPPAPTPVADEPSGERPPPVFAIPPGFEGEEPTELILPPVAVAAGDALPTQTEVGPPAAPVPVAAVGLDWGRLAVAVVTLVWLAGAAACLWSQGRRIARHVSLVRRGAAAPTELTGEIQAVARQLGLRPPRALVARGIASPFVWCLGRLRLIWPESLSSRAEVARSRGVIAHELAHVRRGDHWVAWVELAAGVVWWWNPLFWFVRRRLRETAEMACDALAIGTCPERRCEYAEMLLELSAGFKSGAPAPVLAVSAGTPSSFERRLSMILSDRVSGKVSSWGALAAMLFALAALPGWSLGQARPAEAKAEAPKPPGDDPVLRDLIEQGKFAEAKARLDMLKKQAADKAGGGAFPEKWRETLLKELPAACVKGLPKDAAVSWKTCMTCHGAGPKPVPAQDAWRNLHADIFLDLPVERLAPPDRAAGIDFKGNKRHYRLMFEGNAAVLTASTEDAKVLWKTQFADSLPGRKAEDKWTLDESKDGKVVTLTWTKAGGSMQYKLDLATGKMIQIHMTGSPKSDPNVRNMDAALYSIELERANAALATAQARLDQTRAVTPDGEREVQAARIAQYEAMKQRDLVRARVQDALKVAEAERATAVADYQRMRNAAGGFQHTDEFYKAQARMQAAEANVKQLGDLLEANAQAPRETTVERKGQPNNVAAGAGGSEPKAASVLDLADRYLSATGDLKLARLRLARLAKEPGVAPQKDRDEAQVALEQAEKRERLLAGFVKDALVSAMSEIKLAEDEHAFVSNLVKKGFANPVQAEAAKARLDAAKTRVKQLESILSAGNPPPRPTPKKDRDELPRELTDLVKGLTQAKKSDAEAVAELFEAAVRRKPTAEELSFALKQLSDRAKDRESALTDLAFALIHSKDARDPNRPR
jgi:beta-lactamase regulating signal transducer with metallopeptidase domain